MNIFIETTHTVEYLYLLEHKFEKYLLKRDIDKNLLNLHDRK